MSRSNPNKKKNRKKVEKQIYSKEGLSTIIEGFDHFKKVEELLNSTLQRILSVGYNQTILKSIHDEINDGIENLIAIRKEHDGLVEKWNQFNLNPDNTIDVLTTIKNDSIYILNKLMTNHPLMLNSVKSTLKVNADTTLADSGYMKEIEDMIETVKNLSNMI